MSDEKRLELMKLQFAKSRAHEKDVEALKDDEFFRVFLRSTREVFAQGFEGIVHDGRLICTDFGFRVEIIRPDLLIQLWYGKLDTYVPSIHGEQIALRFAGQAHLRVEDETHSSLFVNWREKILEDLVKSM